MKALSWLREGRGIPVHLKYYLACELCGFCVYGDWRFIDGLPYSKELHRAVLRGELVPLPRGVEKCIKKRVSNVVEAIIAARLLHYANDLYPHVDDPVKYFLEKYPFVPVKLVLRVYSKIADILEALETMGEPVFVEADQL